MVRNDTDVSLRRDDPRRPLDILPESHEIFITLAATNR